MTKRRKPPKSQRKKSIERDKVVFINGLRRFHKTENITQLNVTEFIENVRKEGTKALDDCIQATQISSNNYQELLSFLRSLRRILLRSETSA